MSWTWRIQTALSRDPAADLPTPEYHLAGHTVLLEGASLLHRSHLLAQGITFAD